MFYDLIVADEIRNSLVEVPQLSRNVLEYILILIQKCAKKQGCDEKKLERFVELLCVKSKNMDLFGTVLVGEKCQNPQRLLPILLKMVDNNLDELFGGLPLDEEVKEMEEPEGKLAKAEVETPEEIAGERVGDLQPLEVEPNRTVEQQLNERMRNVKTVEESKNLLLIMMDVSNLELMDEPLLATPKIICHSISIR
jgi:hypothetical protein